MMLTSAPVGKGMKGALTGTRGARLQKVVGRSAMLVRPKASAKRFHIACSASAAGAGAGEDPYKVLGVSQYSGTDEFLKARNIKLRLAGTDEAQVARIEAAYDSIVMRSLMLRSKGQVAGGLNMSKELRFADNQRLFPWAPVKAQSGQKDILINLGIAAVLLAWALLSPFPGMQPMTMGMLPFFFRMNVKLSELFPSPGDKDKAKKHDLQRLIRSFGLTIGAVSAAIILVQGLPLSAAQFFGAPIPLWVLTKREILVNVSTTLSMFVMTSFFR